MKFICAACKYCKLNCTFRISTQVKWMVRGMPQCVVNDCYSESTSISGTGLCHIRNSRGMMTRLVKCRALPPASGNEYLHKEKCIASRRAQGCCTFHFRLIGVPLYINGIWRADSLIPLSTRPLVGPSPTAGRIP